MLYSFCPAAVRWWIEGADPQPLFDPVWQALKDRTSGSSLSVKLEQYGLGDVLDVVKKYVGEVKRYRFHHKNMPAPELLPFFKGGDFPLNRRFGSENGIRNLGGDWKNLFTYVRTWAFLVQDWRAGMYIAKDAVDSLAIEPISLTLPGYRPPVRFEALVWRVRAGHTLEVRLGILVQQGEQDLLRIALPGLSSPAGDHPWPNLPPVYALDRETGEARPADLPLSSRDLPGLVRQLAGAAKDGPYPPLVALQRPSGCKACGYKQLCYHHSNLSPHLLAGK